MATGVEFKLRRGSESDAKAKAHTQDRKIMPVLTDSISTGFHFSPRSRSNPESVVPQRCPRATICVDWEPFRTLLYVRELNKPREDNEPIDSEFCCLLNGHHNRKKRKEINFSIFRSRLLRSHASYPCKTSNT